MMFFRSEFGSGGKRLYGRLGVREEHFTPPSLTRGAKVLDVGAGRGFIAGKMKKEFACDVYALEPCIERDTDYKNCVEVLGADHVDAMTLQDALRLQPDKYFQQFDVITVFKYNVACRDKDEFIAALAQAIKPVGIVYITSVEEHKFRILSRYDEPLYLLNTFRKYFAGVSEVAERRHGQGKGKDLMITLSCPRRQTKEDTVPPAPITAAAFAPLPPAKRGTGCGAGSAPAL